MKYIGTAVTDVGIVKKVNQDSLMLKAVHSPWGMTCMAVICDGLGGLKQGEVASGNVILAFARWFQEEFEKSDEEWTQHRIKEAWEKIVFTMNRKIREYGIQQGIEIGTTLTAVIFIRDKYYVIHVGDCRLYEIRSTCRQITRDQTLMEREMEQGHITAPAADLNSKKHVLLQCIGVSRRLMPDFICGQIDAKASYLLCSDGFRNAVSDKELTCFCKPKRNMSQSQMRNQLQRLVELNKQRGERDNISAIWIQAGKCEKC